jgi:hypothetical protein
MLFAVSPDILHRIEFRGVSRQPLHLDGSSLLGDIVPHQATAVCRQPIPNDRQLARDMSPQVAQEQDDLGSLDASGKELEIEVPNRNAGNGREAFPVEGILQYGSLTARSPGADPMRLLAQSAFVDKDDCSPLLPGFFFISGHRTCFQRWMAGSSRWVARPIGRWQLQPRERKIRHTCPGWYLWPVCRSIRSPTRGVVHNPVPYPKTSGPSVRPRRKAASCSGLKRGLRPARPAFLSPRLPRRCQSACQRRADSRETPVWRATSAWLQPFSNRRAACSRRFSSASKSRFTPLGLPMPQL